MTGWRTRGACIFDNILSYFALQPLLSWHHSLSLFCALHVTIIRSSFYIDVISIRKTRFCTTLMSYLNSNGSALYVSPALPKAAHRSPLTTLKARKTRHNCQPNTELPVKITKFVTRVHLQRLLTDNRQKNAIRCVFQSIQL